MFFFFHLLVGVATGLFLSEVFRSRRWFLPVAAGSILPDLLDKPLGHIIFAETIGYGRIIGHSLIFFGIILFMAFLLWKYRGSVLLFGLGIGVFLHQVLDSMWELPTTWYYPLLGPFPAKLLPDFFINSFWNSLAALQEWLALLLLGAIGVMLLLEWYAPMHPASGLVTRMKYPSMTAAGMVLIGLGISVFSNLSRIESTWLSQLVKGGDPFIMMLALLWCGSIFLWIPLRRLRSDEEA